jgi:hypothetical protein
MYISNKLSAVKKTTTADRDDGCVKTPMSTLNKKKNKQVLFFLYENDF